LLKNFCRFEGKVYPDDLPSCKTLKHQPPNTVNIELVGSHMQVSLDLGLKMFHIPKDILLD